MCQLSSRLKHQFSPFLILTPAARLIHEGIIFCFIIPLHLCTISSTAGRASTHLQKKGGWALIRKRASFIRVKEGGSRSRWCNSRVCNSSSASSDENEFHSQRPGSRSRRCDSRVCNSSSASSSVVSDGVWSARDQRQRSSARKKEARRRGAAVLCNLVAMSNKTGTQQWSGNLVMGNGGGGEFELPQELLSVLPSDPYEQLDVARRITAMAVAARVSKLELETGKLRLKLAEKEHIIHGLQERIGDTESTLQETSSRLSRALDEQVWKLLLSSSILSPL